MTGQRRWLVGAAILAVFTITACARPDATPDADTVGGRVMATVGEDSTEKMADSVERALRADATLGEYNLDAEEEDGLIKLEGRVRTEAQKDSAASVARRAAPGITILNEIRVEP
jgi:osmotically-inducible protein OsmY